MATVTVASAWPIDPYVAGAPIVRRDLDTAIAADVAETDETAETALASWVNGHQPERIAAAPETYAPFTAIVRVTIPSVEGPAASDYLATLA